MKSKNFLSRLICVFAMSLCLAFFGGRIDAGAAQASVVSSGMEIATEEVVELEDEDIPKAAAFKAGFPMAVVYVVALLVIVEALIYVGGSRRRVFGKK